MKMPIPTTHFNTFLAVAEPDDHNEVYALYFAVKHNYDDLPFSCELTDKGYVVSCKNSSLKLRLASEKAREAFLNKIESDYCEGLDIESWHSFESIVANIKND